MTTIHSYKELLMLLDKFSFEAVGFNKVQESEHFISYSKTYPHRDDVYVKVDSKTSEAEIYSWNDKTLQGKVRKGTFNIQRSGEVLFMLTYCLNELRVEQRVLAKCKLEIGYDQTNVVPGRSRHNGFNIPTDHYTSMH